MPNIEAIQQILSLMDTKGIPFLITALFLYFSIKYINIKIFPTKHQDKPDKYRIQSHSILSTLDYIISIGIHRLYMQDRFKQAVFKDFLTTMFKTIRYHIKAILQSDILETEATFKARIIKQLTQMITDYEQAIKDELNPHFSNIPEKVDPAKVLIIKFNQIFESHNHVLFQSVNEICETEVLPTLKQKLAALFYALKSLSMIMMLDAERVYSALDGEFKGWTYKGITSHSTIIENEGKEHAKN